MRGQVITIALVIGSGLAVFIASLSAYHSLVSSKTHYYAASSFADLFATARRAPVSLAGRVVAIPGVAEVDARVVAPAVLDLPGRTLPLTGRMVGLPPDGRPSMNLLHVLAGRMPDPTDPRQALVSAGFAEANRLRPGSSIGARLNGLLQQYLIVGIAVSPEYVFASPPGDPLPDDRRFEVLWVNGAGLAAAFDMEGAFNNIAVRLGPGAVPRVVMAEIDRLLRPYGGLRAHDRSLQASDRFLVDEILQQGTMATTIPPVFLVVAAFLLNAVTARLIGTQREQIAALKAMGYTNAEIARHYAGFVLAMVGLGTILGVVAGVLFGRMMLLSYHPFFRFPSLAYDLRSWVPAVGAGVAAASGLAGAATALRAAFRLAPAEAMRPPAPAVYRRLGVDAWASGCPAWSPRRGCAACRSSSRPVSAPPGLLSSASIRKPACAARLMPTLGRSRSPARASSCRRASPNGSASASATRSRRNS
nr:ABC transporter permease [Prosthecomicrobium hirschii]